MSLSQDDVDAIAKAITDSMEDKIFEIVKFKIQLCLGIDCTKNEDLVRVRKVIDFAGLTMDAAETLKVRAFYGFWGLVCAGIIALGGVWMNHTVGK